MQHFQVFKVPFSFAKMGPQKAVVQKVSPFGPHPQELHASFQESPSVLNNFKSIMDCLLMCKCVKSFLPYLLFPSLSMQTFFSSIVLAPELAPGKLTTPAPLLLLLFLVPDDSDTGDTISSGVLVLSSKSMLQNLLVQPGTSLSVHRHLEKKWRVTYMIYPCRILLMLLAASLHSVPEKLFIVQILGPSSLSIRKSRWTAKGRKQSSKIINF